MAVLVKKRRSICGGRGWCHGGIASMPGSFLFERDICTGLGDRLGLVLTLAAFARLEDAVVVFPWCEDPGPVLPRLTAGIPTWRGYNFSLAEFRRRFELPKEVALVRNVTSEHWGLPRVRWENVGVQAEHGSDSVYTVAWRTMRLGRADVGASEFGRAYKRIGTALASKWRRREPYAVLHLRGPDANTPDAYDHDPSAFCTGKVVRRLQRLGLRFIAMSNNCTWANDLLGGHLRVSCEDSEAYDDLGQLLGASAIVQHVWGGWSSFSSVPALAASIPMITTFRGTPFRPGLFQAQGGAPPEMFACGRREAFVRRVGAVL